MFAIFVKTALKNLKRNSWLSLINIIGLAIGITSASLIYLYVDYELHYDSFHENSKSIYRVGVRSIADGELESNSSIYVSSLAPELEKTFPEIINAVRFTPHQPKIFRYQEKSLKIDRTIYADANFFDVFSFRFFEGSSSKALSGPFSMVLTQSTAAKIFGDEPALGRVVNLGDGHDYKVNGIIEDVPVNSHIQFQAIISFPTLLRDDQIFLGWNGGHNYYSYLMLRNDADPLKLEQKFPAFMWEKINRAYAEYGLKDDAYLTPLESVYLHSQTHDEHITAGNLTSIYIFSIIAFFIVLMACINYISITTASAINRFKEMSVRKVLGASKKNLMSQILIESVLTVLFAFGIALIFVELITPYYSGFLEKDIQFLSWLSVTKIIYFVSFIILLGLISGIYPSWYMASTNTTQSLKGQAFNKPGRVNFRNVLVIIQFTISIILFTCTFIIYDQVKYAKNKDLGYSQDYIVNLPLTDENASKKYELLKERFLKEANIESIGASSEIPGAGLTSNGYIPEDITSPVIINVLDVDDGYLETMQIEILLGRNFSTDITSDKNNYLVNEAFVKWMGWKDPIGKTIQRNGEHEVIGVVKDFHYTTVHEKIAPLIITNKPWNDQFQFISVRMLPQNLTTTIARLETIWQEILPYTPFEFSFMTDSFYQIYKSEIKFNILIFVFTLLAIMLGLAGLYGLTFFTVKKKNKEIAIRKVCGATSLKILMLLSNKFLKKIILANIIAIPISFYVMNKWLENFTYKISIGAWFFFIALIFSAAITLITTWFHTMKAANRNPAETLLYE
ncbi:ABC transporter permease [Fulvivirgaceae bacterium BMA10]|uniref:ABC transporter permease n=1 Tax=Splendidivirga corallicola TaxID=3051826 RepID=A0ABT8KL20_9BACT|nr:ABC transporter permease [Fulvivirgaceae bacterium BMA10]